MASFLCFCEKLERDLQHFDDCAVAGSGDGADAGRSTFYFVATDETNTQAAATKVLLFFFRGGGTHVQPSAKRVG